MKHGTVDTVDQPLYYFLFPRLCGAAFSCDPLTSFFFFKYPFLCPYLFLLPDWKYFHKFSSWYLMLFLLRDSLNSWTHCMSLTPQSIPLPSWPSLLLFSPLSSPLALLVFWHCIGQADSPLRFCIWCSLHLDCSPPGIWRACLIISFRSLFKC